MFTRIDLAWRLRTIDDMAQRKRRKSNTPPPNSDAIEQLAQILLTRIAATPPTPTQAPAAAPRRANVEAMVTIVLRVPRAMVERLDTRGANRSEVARDILAKALGLPPPRPMSPKGTRR
jgi:hypothetical protein